MKVSLRIPPAPFSSKPWARRPELRSVRGIALVVTLILLSVITFLTVAFLFLTTREKGAVANTLDQAASRHGTEIAVENAKAQIIASLISSNPFNYRLIVSTNYVNQNGFVDGSTSLTNVNYDFLSLQSGGGTNFTIDQRNLNIANQYYAPRPPVFPATNRNGRGEFRFYLDLNQNGRFDTNGSMIEIGNRGTPLRTLDTNTGGSMFVTNFFVGDPEWIGVLERPDRPHSSSNRFVARYCFIAVPTGKTLDINTIHNQAKFPTPTADGFLRNMGVAPFEMNLAAFLVDLNTNVWQRNPGSPGSLPTAYINPAPYAYSTSTNPLPPSTGTAFEDALALTRYRYNGNWNNLKSIFGLFGNAGAAAIQTDGGDQYSAGPLLLTNTTPIGDGDITRTGFPWPGAENLNHFFTTQDLLDRKKTTGAGQGVPFYNNFSDRLLNAGYFGNSFYDRYTFYRLLSQMGMDTPPDPTLTNKVNLNYVNVTNGTVVSDMQTNFVAWTSDPQYPTEFFMDAADRVLRATFADTNANFTNFGVASVLSVSNIPVLISNRFVYTPSVHRALQVTANIWDAAVTRHYGASNAVMPTVFSPIFKRVGGDVYIEGYEELKDAAGMWDNYSLRPLKDLVSPTVVAGLNPRDRVLGVPLIIGAKKGFPNFNEFSLQSLSQVTRKVILHRVDLNSRPSQTNQLYIVGISNAFGFEAWNSYQQPYGRSVDIYVSNIMDVSFRYTNDTQLDLRGSVTNIPMVSGRFLPLTAGWAGTGFTPGQPKAKSFQVPLSTNYMMLTNSALRMPKGRPPYFESTNLNVMNLAVAAPLSFDNTGEFPVPEMVLSVTNRIVFTMVDHETGRIIDYVHLSGLGSKRDLVYDTGSTQLPPYDSFWDRARSRNILTCPPQGIVRQIFESQDTSGSSGADWGTYSVPINDKGNAIRNFRVFCGLSPADSQTSPSVATAYDMQAPYTPVRRVSERLSWQVNDPLVHYTVGDLTMPNDKLHYQVLKYRDPITMLATMTNLNSRYRPWGGNPGGSSLNDSADPSDPLAFSLEVKDPGVYGSDSWDFPTNKFATVGLLGRVHRGTPWQTVYLKANDLDGSAWTNWTGNGNFLDASMSRPVMDRVLIDVFSTAIDQNTTRGQLNVNQTGIAAWSALLGGVIALTNTSADFELQATPATNSFAAFVIDPAGADPAGLTNSILGKIVDGVNRTRTAAPFNGSFKKLGDILAVPELTTASPMLNTNTLVQRQKGINDAVYERLPQQLLGLMRGGDQPSFTVYAFGQALHPANHSIVTSGSHFGLCTNYQITAEFATRSVVRIEGTSKNPKAVVESFNVLPTD